MTFKKQLFFLFGLSCVAFHFNESHIYVLIIQNIEKIANLTNTLLKFKFKCENGRVR